MKVLALLLENPGALVTRDELRKKLWPEELYVDFEHGLNRSINKLRRALLDDATSPRFIETLSTRGYRFIATVDIDPKRADLAGTAPSANPKQESASPFQPLNRRRALFVIMGAIAFLAMMGLSLWRPSHHAAGISLTAPRLRSVPLITFANGSQCLPAFSPDGSRVAYSWGSDTGWYLEVKDVASDTHIRLTQLPADFPPGPAWSPDGRQIAFARAGATGDRGIFIISSLGGGERKLHSLALWHVPQRIVSWSLDGHWIAFADEVHPNSVTKSTGRGPNAIYLISPASLEIRQLTQPPPGDFGDSTPAFSPDGATVAFVRTRANSHDEIYTIPVQGGDPHPLVSEGLWTNGLAWAADGKSIVFDRSLAGGFRLWTVSSTGADPHPLDLPCGFTCMEPTIWRDHLAYESHEKTRSVGRIDLHSVHPQPLTPVASTRHEHDGRYSPDGKRIAFLSDRTGSDELWIADSDGTHAVQLTQLKTPFLLGLSWEPHGNSIAVSTFSGQVYLVSLQTQITRPLFEGLPFTDETVPGIAFSQSGDSLYVLSQPGTGESYDLLRVPITGGTPTKMVAGRLTNFAESFDGKNLFYSRADGLWKRPVNGGAEQLLIRSTSSLWDLRPDGIYLLTDAGVIERYSLNGKLLQTVAKLGRFGVSFPVSISPNGRWVLVGIEQRKTDEIDAVQGFN